MPTHKTPVDLKRYVKENMRREVGVPEHVTTFVMEQMDNMYLIGYDHGMCDTCKKTGQVRQPGSPYDLRRPGRRIKEGR